MASVAQIKLPDSALDQALGNVLRTAHALLGTDALALFLSDADAPDAWLGGTPEQFSYAAAAYSQFRTRAVVPLGDGRARLLLLWRAADAPGADRTELREAISAMLS